MGKGPKASTRTDEQKQETAALNEAALQNPGAVPLASGEVMQPKRSGAKVTVACKLGVAYYAIQLTRMDDKFEQNTLGGRMVREGTREGPVVRLRGTAYPRGTPPKGFPPPPIIVEGAALNPNIDKDFWDAWVEQHKLDPLVVNRLIFAHEDLAFVQAMAKEEAANQSGLEPMDPSNAKDSRLPRSTRGEVTDVAPGQRGS